ncbi:hypothetical protein ACVQ9Z_10005 [Staphylococcus aureus]
MREKRESKNAKNVSNNIFKRSQEINNRESERACLCISMLILLFLLILFGITVCSSSIHFIN